MSTHIEHKQQICWPLSQEVLSKSAFCCLSFLPPPLFLQLLRPPLHPDSNMPKNWSEHTNNLRRNKNHHHRRIKRPETEMPGEKKVGENYRTTRNSHIDYNFLGAIEIVGIGIFLTLFKFWFWNNLNTGNITWTKETKKAND